MIRKQVPTRELSEFDERVGPSYDKALAAIDSFMKFQTKYQPAHLAAAQQNETEGDKSKIDMSG